jgi:hypothetical protein
MAFTKQTRKALRQSRQGKVSDYLTILQHGERAALAKLPRECPLVDSEDAAIWFEGYDDAEAHS